MFPYLTQPLRLHRLPHIWTPFSPHTSPSPAILLPLHNPRPPSLTHLTLFPLPISLHLPLSHPLAIPPNPLHKSLFSLFPNLALFQRMITGAKLHTPSINPMPKRPEAREALGLFELMLAMLSHLLDSPALASTSFVALERESHLFLLSTPNCPKWKNYILTHWS